MMSANFCSLTPRADADQIGTRWSHAAHLGGHHGPTYPRSAASSRRKRRNRTRPLRRSIDVEERPMQRLHGEFDGVRLHHDGVAYSPNTGSDVVENLMIRRRQDNTVGGLV